MPLVINTNVSALNAQRQLVQSGNDLNEAMQRLSSGKRINNAADDAAGLAISNRQNAQIRGLDQAIRNANDGVSLIQTAEGALDETTNMLQRIRELSLQAANGIYTDLDRQTLDAEVQQLKLELDRIAKSTTFNGQTLLDGTLQDVKLQVGSEARQTIDLNIPSFTTSSLGSNSGDYVGVPANPGLGAFTALAGGDELQINDVNISDLSSATNTKELLSIMNGDLDGKGAEASTLIEVTATSTGNGILAPGTSFDFELLDGDGATQAYSITGTSSLEELAQKISDETAVTAKVNNDGKLIMTAENAETITVTGDVATATGGVATTQFALVLTDTSADSRGVKIENAGAMTAGEQAAIGVNVQDDNSNWQGAVVTATTGVSLNAGDFVVNGVEIGQVTAGAAAANSVDNMIEAINLLSSEHGVVAYEVAADQIGLRSTSGEPISIKYGDGAAAADVLAMTGFIEMNAAEGTGSVSGIKIDTIEGAQAAISVVDTALEQINALRSDLGAINNRLDFTMANLANVSENTSAAKSRIVDADFAAESAKLSRSQVLQQASQAMLAQANAQPQQVLQLLQG